MTFEEMQGFLSNVQAEQPETKIMNALLSCYQQVKQHEKMIIELQEKVNEIAKNWNQEIEGVNNDGIEDAETAEALNPDIEEDVIEEDDIVDYTGSAAPETSEVE